MAKSLWYATIQEKGDFNTCCMDKIGVVARTDRVTQGLYRRDPVES